MTEPTIESAVQMALKKLQANANLSPRDLRTRLAQAISGGYDAADTLHDVYLDFGYPLSLSFANFWNMYRRLGIAKNLCDLPVDYTWSEIPEFSDMQDAWVAEFEKLAKAVKFWQRIKGLDNRQRVGRYAGLFMRVRDDKKPSEPMEKVSGGITSLVQMVPLYEGQLEVKDIENDPLSERFGMPLTYQFNGGSAGNRNEKELNSFTIHYTRVVIAAEGADNGGIYGIPAMEACYNSLMDLRKIIGAGGEGFYRNASQSMVFKLLDVAGAAQNAELLQDFSDNADDFMRNRQRRSLFAPGMDVSALESSLVTPKEFFMNALNDCAACSKIPATILIGQQTGRLASNEDGRSFLSMIKSRRENYASELVMEIIDWFMQWGILKSAEVELEWPDVLAPSDQEKLDSSVKMAEVNAKQFSSGGAAPFSAEEIREAAGYDPDEMEGSEIEPEGEELGDQDES